VIVRLNSCEFSYLNGPRLLAAEMLHSVALRGEAALRELRVIDVATSCWGHLREMDTQF
jgi:hypothetical protein